MISNGHDNTCWIGLSDLDTEGTFIWESGTELSGDVARHWYSGEPNNADGNENCVTVGHSDGSMNDMPCQAEVKFICQA